MSRRRQIPASASSSPSRIDAADRVMGVAHDEKARAAVIAASKAEKSMA